jgi:hypothetical protein
LFPDIRQVHIGCHAELAGGTFGPAAHLRRSREDRLEPGLAKGVAAKLRQGGLLPLKLLQVVVVSMLIQIEPPSCGYLLHMICT